MNRFSFLVLGTVLASGSVVFACNGTVEGTPSGADGGGDGAAPAADAASSTEGGTATDGSTPAEACVAKGGMCIGKDQTPPPNHEPAGACANGDVCWMPITATTGACAADPDCNESPATSALTGKCFHGVCMCNAGLYVQPNGKCGKAPPGTCAASSGKCRQMPAACQAGELAGEMPTNMSCGDLIEAVCCFADVACKSPTKNGAKVEFRCCMPNDGIEDPVCVNGWKVCPQGGEARTDTSGCGG